MSLERMSGEERRAQIIREATELFANHGFKGTTIKQIAEQAGITEALVFRYFTTKEELYSAILETKCQQGTPSATLQKAMQARDDERVLQTVAQFFLEENRRDPTLMRLLLFSALEDHQLANLFFHSRMVDLFEELADYIDMRIQEKAFTSMDPKLAARGFVGMIVYQFLMRELFKHQEFLHYDSEHLARNYSRLFLQGMYCHGQPSPLPPYVSSPSNNN